MKRTRRERREARPGSWLGKTGLVVGVLPWLFHLIFLIKPPC